MMEVMTPKEIVSELDKHIIGQEEAKRSVAIALRDRWRRSKIEDAKMREEIMPKNILMIGPTGVGKTEIARRLARLAKAPFIKVEATKFTEVGYVGRDVDSIIRDLADMSVKMQREVAVKEVESLAEDAAEERVLDALLPPARSGVSFEEEPVEETERDKERKSSTRQTFRKRFREGELDEKEIEIQVSANSQIGVEIMAPPGMEEMTGQLQNIFQSLSSDKKKAKKMKVKEAFRILKDEEASKLLNEEEIKAKAIENLEQNGIVFIDEIDKVTRRENAGGADVSREGVQRDLLPLIEGSSISTRYGVVNTDHILFITSGAFHMAKPSDLIAELQGRLPVRVELKALTAEDFTRILTEPDASLTEQYQALMSTEGVTLKFTEGGIKRIAELAFQVNEQTENIGARRLHTIMERLLETLSFEASDRGGEKFTIDAKYVDQHLENLVQDEDLSHFIL